MYLEVGMMHMSGGRTGSYSYLPVGATPADRTELARPCGPLLFAGEATAARFPSTVHGA